MRWLHRVKKETNALMARPRSRISTIGIFNSVVCLHGVILSLPDAVFLSGQEIRFPKGGFPQSRSVRNKLRKGV